ncbi:MAG: hypothetical protein ACPG77_21070 [Nannocystaceae bacterium]
MSFASENQGDFLMLAIERLARAVRQAVTGRGSGQTEEHEDELEDGQLDRECDLEFAREFGSMHVHLCKVDAMSVVGLLKPVSRLRAYATLLGCKAVLAHRQGEAVETQATRALDVLLHTIAREQELAEPPVHPTDLGLVVAVLKLADVNALAPASAALLERVASSLKQPALQAGLGATS